MLRSTDGLPGPVIVNRFGNPAMPMPGYVRGPAAYEIGDDAVRVRRFLPVR
jgi:hypothetical protein